MPPPALLTLVARLRAAPRRLFVLDGAGALASALALGVAAPPFAARLGATPATLHTLAVTDQRHRDDSCASPCCRRRWGRSPRAARPAPTRVVATAHAGRGRPRRGRRRGAAWRGVAAYRSARLNAAGVRSSTGSANASMQRMRLEVLLRRQQMEDLLTAIKLGAFDGPQECAPPPRPPPEPEIVDLCFVDDDCDAEFD